MLEISVNFWEIREVSGDGVYLMKNIAPELSAHLSNSELTPLPDLFFLEQSGLTLLYPVSRLSTLSDRAGDIRIGWIVLKDELDLSEDSVPERIGVPDMIELTGQGAAKLRADAAEGMLTGIPITIGDSVQELTDRYIRIIDDTAAKKEKELMEV